MFFAPTEAKGVIMYVCMAQGCPAPDYSIFFFVQASYKHASSKLQTVDFKLTLEEFNFTSSRHHENSKPTSSGFQTEIKQTLSL